jgi:hypothetical protein
MRRQVTALATAALAFGAPRIATAGCGGGAGGFFGELIGELIADGAGNAIAAIPHLEFGAFGRRVDGALDDSGRLDHTGGSFGYRVATTSPDTAATAIGLGVRLASTGQLYYGMDLEFGGVVDRSPIGVSIDDHAGSRSPTVSSERAGFAGVGGVVGVRHKLGRFGASAEVVAGYRAIMVDVDSSYGSCELTEQHRIDKGFVEPRLRIDTRLSDSAALVGFAGTDLRGRLDSVGLNLAFEQR